MKKLITTNDNINYDIANATSHHSLVIQASLSAMLDKLGQPSYVGSGDNKAQLDWTFYSENKNRVITIYDYKENKPIHKITEWNIGSKNLTEDEIIAFFKNYNLKLTKTIVEGTHVYRKEIN